MYLTAKHGWALCHAAVAAETNHGGKAAIKCILAKSTLIGFDVKTVKLNGLCGMAEPTRKRFYRHRGGRSEPRNFQYGNPSANQTS